MNLSYTYDHAGQLTDVTGDIEQHFRYDATGNMTYNSDLGTYLYDAATVGEGCGSPSNSISCPHAVKSADSSRMHYDAAGNMTSITSGAGAKTTIQWNRNGEPYSFKDDSGVETKARYGDSGERIYRNRSGQVTLYYDPYVDLDYTGAGPVKSIQYYFAGDFLIAKKDDSIGKRWFHLDHIGSTRLTTDQSGQATARFDYKPFGEPAGAGGISADADRRFAGHRLDSDNALIYMRARYYSPTLGRFISADPTVPATYQGRSSNRYAYVYNNPVTLVDPLGLQGSNYIEKDLGVAPYPTSGFGSIHSYTSFMPPPVPPVPPPANLGGSLNAPIEDQAASSLLRPEERLLPDPRLSLRPRPVFDDPATAARRLLDLAKMVFLPFRVTSRAVGNVVEANANGCGVFCFLLGDVTFGWLMTPAGPNDWFFGDIHIFGGLGGSILGLTPGPNDPINFLALGRPSGWQYSLGLSAGIGASAYGFVTEANTREAFSEFARNAGASIGPFSGFRSENSSGQATYGFGLGVGRSWFLGANVFNSYTWVSPGIWPSWLPTIPYRADPPGR
jgi:RHS repeat-associated protein